MRSFVIWYERREEKNNEDCKNDNCKIDIHVNLWKIKKTGKEEFVFDFGFLIEDITKVESIFFYIPFKIRENDWKDLGYKILNKHILADAIFNEKTDVCTVKVGKRIKITKEKEESFMIYSLGKDQVEILDQTDSEPGCILKIDISNILSNNEISQHKEIENIKKYYFRFRLKCLKKNLKLVRDIEYNKNIFSNAFSNTEIIDFRINDTRACTEGIKEKYESNFKFKIQKIHYLLLRNFSDEFIYYDGAVKSRILETDLWKEYIEEIDDDLIAYHIKKIIKQDKIENEDTIEGIDSFINLSRFRYSKTNYSEIIKYIFIIIFYSVVSGLILEIYFTTSLKNQIKDYPIIMLIVILLAGPIIAKIINQFK